jgi:hypothetical protein
MAQLAAFVNTLVAIKTRHRRPQAPGGRSLQLSEIPLYLGIPDLYAAAYAAS